MCLIPNAKFTLHGYLRIVGSEGEQRRLLLSPEAVAEILDEGKAVPVGREGDRVHRAFYSAPDKECFIAVQDSVNGEVVTILPFSHHWRWILDEAQVWKMAINLHRHGLCSLPVEKVPVVAGPDTDCVVTMGVLHPTDNQRNIINKHRLKRFLVDEGSLLNEVIQSSGMREDIELEVAYKLNSHPIGSQIYGFRVHFVSKGVASEFLWFEKDWTVKIM